MLWTVGRRLSLVVASAGPAPFELGLGRLGRICSRCYGHRDRRTSAGASACAWSAGAGTGSAPFPAVMPAFCSPPAPVPALKGRTGYRLKNIPAVSRGGAPIVSQHALDEVEPGAQQLQAEEQGDRVERSAAVQPAQVACRDARPDGQAAHDVGLPSAPARSRSRRAAQFDRMSRRRRPRARQAGPIRSPPPAGRRDAPAPLPGLLDGLRRLGIGIVRPIGRPPCSCASTPPPGLGFGRRQGRLGLQLRPPVVGVDPGPLPPLVGARLPGAPPPARRRQLLTRRRAARRRRSIGP